MKVLVVAPMDTEKRNFTNCFDSAKPSKNQYKVIKTGVGKVNAACEVGIELASGEYDIIAVVGYAAGSPHFNQGEVVFPNACQYHDTFIPEGIDVAKELTKLYELEGMDEVRCLSGDQFVDKELGQAIHNVFGDEKYIIDMEAAAVCQVAEEFKVPVIVMKFISDIPLEENNALQFNEFVEQHSDFSMFYHYLETLSDNY